MKVIRFVLIERPILLLLVVILVLVLFKKLGLKAKGVVDLLMKF